jgi:chromosome segregation ATPase
MKRLLPNLLILFALALCGLCVFQWIRESKLRADLVQVNGEIYEKKELIRNLQAAIKRSEAEVQRLDALKVELTGLAKTNRQQIAQLQKDVRQGESEIEKHLKQMDIYKDALQAANESIRKQNDDIKRQNQEVRDLIEERKTTVEKFNKLASEYNDLVTKWNQQQEELKKPDAGTAPAKKKE